MTKSFTLLAFISLSLTSLFSQPILDNTIFPVVGDTINFIYSDTDQGILPGTSGENVTWDFSNFDLSGSTNTVIYKNPNETPLGNNFPNANMVLFYSSFQIEYYKKTNDSITYLGQSSSGIGLQIYSNSRLDFKLPFNFGETFTDSYATNFVNGNGLSVSRTGNVKRTYDGYGTLILPNITIPNCLRIKSVVYTHDVQGSNSEVYYDTLYHWYLPSIRDYIIYSLSTTISGTHYSFAYIQDNININSVAEMGADNFSISPNPASQKINITIPTASDFQENCLFLDARGRAVKSLKLTEKVTQIDISDLISGIYFVRIGNAIEKISIE